MKRALAKIPKRKLGDEDLISHDLAAKVGSLVDKEKITIRLDVRVINQVKREAERLGVGYQKLINDRLIAHYGLGEPQYLKSMEEMFNEMEKRLEKRMDKLLEKKRA
jgi:predicted DNA binding CopG/RHH family protein